MANFFVDSAAVADGLGGGDAGTAANPWLLLQSAIAANGVAAGDNIFVAATHAQTQASALTYTNPGTTASPCFIYCVPASSFAGPPATGDLTTGGSVTTTGTNAIALNGTFYCYGLIFSSGTGASTVNLTVSNTAGNSQVYESCSLRLAATAGTGNILVNTSGALVLENTTMQFGAVGNGFSPGMGTVWKNTPTALLGATIPTTLFAFSSGARVVYVEAVDFSAMVSKTLCPTNTTVAQRYVFKDCKIASTTTVVATQTGAYGIVQVDLVRVDSAAVTYRNERHASVGKQTTDNTIVRTGGASDGTTTIAWQLTTNANSKWVMPFESQPISIWSDTTGSKTVTIYGTTTGGGVPNNDDIWIEVEYLGDATAPQGSYITTTKANNLAASTTTNNSADGSTWSGGGAGNGFKMVTPSFTTNMKGPITVRVMVADNSATYYIDPLVVVT